MRADGGLGQDGNSKDGKKGSDFAYISKKNLTVYVNGLDVGCERKCKIRDDARFLA